MHRFFGLCLLVVLLDSALLVPSISQQQATAETVKVEFLHAWNAYKQYAWGHDQLKPLSRQPHDWYGTSLLMTPVDAYDTMLLMGLTTEADPITKTW